MHCYRLIRLSKNRKPGAFCYRVFLSLYNGNLKTKSIHLYHVREKGFLHQRGFCQGSPSSQGSASMAFYHFQFCLHPGIPSRGSFILVSKSSLCSDGKVCVSPLSLHKVMLVGANHLGFKTIYPFQTSIQF